MRIGAEPLRPIREKMQRTISLQVEDATLSEVVDRCAAAGGFSVSLNLNSPEVEQLARISEMTLDLQDVTIETALDRALHPHGLEWVVRRDDLYVMTQSDVDDNFPQVAVFDVTPLVDAGIDGDTIIDTVQNLTAGPWFDLDGFGGHVGEHESLLFVRQTPRQLEMTEQLLETMRSAVAGQLEHGSREVLMRTGQRESVVPWKSHDMGSELIESELFTKVYDIRDLQRYGLIFEPDARLSPTLKAPGNAVDYARSSKFGMDELDDRWYGFDVFLDIMEDVTSGPWYDLEGTGGLVTYAGAGILVIRHTEEMHREVETLLKDVRTGFSDREPPEPLDINRIETHLYRIDVDVESAESVLEAIETFIAPESWGDDNADTGIRVVGNAIVVRNTYAVHVQIQELLSEAGVWTNRRPFVGMS